MIRQMTSQMRTLVADQRGLSAIEFAFIFPIMLVLYFGGVEIVEGVAINRMVAITAGTITNLVSRYSTISASQQMPDMLNASAQILGSNAAPNATVVVTCISIDGSGKATVTWSQALNGTAKATGAVLTVPPALATPNSTVILGEASYAYTPIIDFAKLGTITLKSYTYMLPRASAMINLVP